MGKKRRGSSSGKATMAEDLRLDQNHDSAPGAAAAPPPPQPDPLVQLVRHAHVANAGCAGRCRPRSALQAQAQAQPRHLSFRVTAAVLGHLLSESGGGGGGGHVLVLALSTPQPSLLLRVVAAASGPGGHGDGTRPRLEAGDYLYEFSSLPSAGATAASGAVGRRGVGAGLGAAAAAMMHPEVACLALSEDGGRLLCVTREGTALGLRIHEVLQAATRVEEWGGAEDEDGKRRRHPWTINPSGPSLLEYAMDPRFLREASAAAAAAAAAAGVGRRRGKDISLGSNSTEGDFAPHCCVWWTPAVAAKAGGRLPASNMAIVGGVSGGRGALSIVDMDQEREVDLIYLCSPQTAPGAAPGAGAAVTSLRLFTLPAAPRSGSGSEAPSQERLLLATLAGGEAYSLVLESPQDPTPDPAALALASSSSPSGWAGEDGPGGSGVGASAGGPSTAAAAAASPPRPRRLSGSLLTTPKKQQQQQGGRLPPVSPGTPPARSTSPSLSTTSSPLSTVPGSPSSASFSSLLTASTPLRQQPQGKKGGGGGRRKGSTTSDGAQQLVPGFFPASSLGESVEEEEREATSLWDRCSARVDNAASGPMPRQPRARRLLGKERLGLDAAVLCFAAPDVGGGGEQKEGVAEKTLLVARLVMNEEDGGTRVEVALEGHAVPSITPSGTEHGAAVAPFVARATLLRLPLEEDLAKEVGSVGLWVERLAEARLLGGPGGRLLALSLACAEDDQGGDGCGAVRSFWLVVYSLSNDDGNKAAPRLLQAFRSPTGSALRCLGALSPASLGIRDVLALASTRLFQEEGVGPEGMAVWSLVLWSRCSVLFLRVLDRDDTTTAAGGAPPLSALEHVPDDALQGALAAGPVRRKQAQPPPQQQEQEQGLNPDVMLAFVKTMAARGPVGRRHAITLAWHLLLDAPPPPKGPSLHPSFFARLKGADPSLQRDDGGGEGRAELALACLEWMMDDGDELYEAAGGGGSSSSSSSSNSRPWSKEDLLLFLEACPDYPLSQAVDQLLAKGRVSAALLASWAREKVPGVAQTLERLAALASSPASSFPTPPFGRGRRLLPLSRSDVAWLCGVGAGRAVVLAGRSLLWASLPRRLQLDVLLADRRLLLLPDQYQDLAASVPRLPRASLAALALQLAFWLGVGPAPTANEPPPLPLTPRLMQVSSSPARGARAMEEYEQQQQQPVRLVVAWASDEELTAGLMAAVDAFLASQPPPAQEREQRTEEADDEEENGHDEEEHDDEDGQAERESRDRRRLADLLLHALILLAQPLAHSRLALQAHALAAAAATTITTTADESGAARPSRSEGLSLSLRAALEAQVLLELLVRSWSRAAPAPTASPQPSPSAAAFPRNPRFTPAVLLALAMAGGKGGAIANVGAAALVLEAAGKPEAALELRLEEAEAVAMASSSSAENLEEELAALLVGLVRSHVLLGRGAGVEWEARRRMAARVLEAWARLRLAPGPFEALVMKEGVGEREHGCSWEKHMLTALLVDLLVLHAGDPSSPADAHGAVLGQLRFSPQLYVRLCQHVLDHGQEMQLGGVTDLWSTGGRPSGLLCFHRPLSALWKALYQQIQDLEPQAAASQRIELSPHKLREASVRSQRFLSSLAAVGGGRASAPSRRIVVGRGAEEERVSVVAFNCGHVLGQAELLQRALPALEAQLTQGLSRPLPLTTEMLSQEYRTVASGDACAAVACPDCVAAHLTKVVARQEARGEGGSDF